MDFAAVGSGYVAEGLIRGQTAVVWATDRHTAHAMFLQPRNTLLWRSKSSAPSTALVPLCDSDGTFSGEQFVIGEEVPSSIGQREFGYDSQIVVELASPVRED